jgi:hypothetical protein
LKGKGRVEEICRQVYRIWRTENAIYEKRIIMKTYFLIHTTGSVKEQATGASNTLRLIRVS